MFSVFILSVFLFYFWYFYMDTAQTVPKPTTGAASPPRAYRFQIQKKKDNTNTFQFLLDNTVVWEHTIPGDRYLFRRGVHDVIAKDPCYTVPNSRSIPAKGPELYEYLKHHPSTKHPLNFQQDTPYALQEGHVFYFTCMSRSIQSLGICPSGTLFQNSTCVPITACTGHPDNTYLADPADITHYIQCYNNGRERHRYCGNDQFFYHDRCVSKNDLAYVCKIDPNRPAFQMDPSTRVACHEGETVVTRCGPGTQFFDLSDACESTACVGEPDGLRLPLPEREIGPFRFVPGYAECLGGRVQPPETCPQVWDDLLSRGDNLTHLPRVFDGHRCSVPSLCENVQPTDPNVIVPVHEFTRDVRNWTLSELYDTAVGYTCERGQKRRQELAPRFRIKRFKIDEGCDPNRLRLPVRDQPHQYYDCLAHQVTDCRANEYFNGEVCVERPENAFTYRNIPIFQFDHLNLQSWIEPMDYVSHPIDAHQCQPPESTHVKLYNVCSHPDCTPYAFLSMTPDFSLLLPRERAQCRYVAAENKLVKEPVDHHYRYWDQKVLPPGLHDPNVCTPGQTLKTGHFIWDSTVYATCDDAQPFLFCPSVHTRQLVQVGGEYACDVDLPNLVPFSILNQFTPFATNEVRKILPKDWDGTDGLKPNKSYKQYLGLPVDGYEVPPNTRLTLSVNKPVELQLRYRVTYPPHIVFEYDEQNQRSTQTAAHDLGYIVRLDRFTNNALTFPKYTPQTHVPSLTPQLV